MARKRRHEAYDGDARAVRAAAAATLRHARSPRHVRILIGMLAEEAAGRATSVDIAELYIALGDYERLAQSRFNGGTE